MLVTKFQISKQARITNKHQKLKRLNLEFKVNVAHFRMTSITEKLHCEFLLNQVIIFFKNIIALQSLLYKLYNGEELPYKGRVTV